MDLEQTTTSDERLNANLAYIARGLESVRAGQRKSHQILEAMHAEQRKQTKEMSNISRAATLFSVVLALTFIASAVALFLWYSGLR